MTLQVVPPDAARTWVAEIEWRQDGGTARFCIVARAPAGPDRVRIAESLPLEWPPVGPASVQALSEAAGQLEAALAAAGWTQLEPGSAWFAKRFAWEPPAAPADAIAVPSAGDPSVQGLVDRAVDPPLAPPAPWSPFARPLPWPDDTRALWRCELKWEAGWIDSRFRAIAYRPQSTRGRAFGASAPLKWLLMSQPDPRSADHEAALDGLASALETDGWQWEGDGASWYSRRFSWRREGEPDLSGNAEPMRMEPQ